MMKGLMFLSLVGAAIYALLVYTNDALKDGNAEITYAGQAQSNYRRRAFQLLGRLSSHPGCKPEFAIGELSARR